MVLQAIWAIVDIHRHSQQLLCVESQVGHPAGITRHLAFELIARKVFLFRAPAWFGSIGPVPTSGTQPDFFGFSWVAPLARAGVGISAALLAFGSLLILISVTACHHEQETRCGSCPVVIFTQPPLSAASQFWHPAGIGRHLAFELIARKVPFCSCAGIVRQHWYCANLWHSAGIFRLLLRGTAG